MGCTCESLCLGGGCRPGAANSGESPKHSPVQNNELTGRFAVGRFGKMATVPKGETHSKHKSLLTRRQSAWVGTSRLLRTDQSARLIDHNP